MPSKTTVDSSMLDDALAYHSQGYMLAPAYSPRMFRMATFKNALFNKWLLSTGKVVLSARFFKSALRTPEDIHYWFTRYPHANIKIITGVQSGIIILDVDYKNGGKEKAAQLNLPETRQVESGDGCHYYFLHPKDMALHTLRHAFGRDVSISFMADGGGVILPPSLHANGNVYRWQNPQTAIAPLPLELLSKLTPHNRLSVAYQQVHFYFLYVLIVFPMLRLLLWIKHTPWLKWLAKYL